MKTCCTCRQSFPPNKDFFQSDLSAKDGLCNQCLTCSRATHKRYRENLRKMVLSQYGRDGKTACACCGESQIEFLSLDHIDGGGAEQRREIHKGGRQNTLGVYLWAKKNHYPPIFQVLCHNCNLAKGFYGTCPHASR